MKNARLFGNAALIVFTGLFAIALLSIVGAFEGCSRPKTKQPQKISLAAPLRDDETTRIIPMGRAVLNEYNDGSACLTFYHTGEENRIICALSPSYISVRKDTALDGTYLYIVRDKTIDNPQDGRYLQVFEAIVWVRTEEQKAEWEKFILALREKDLILYEKKMQTLAPRDVLPPPLPVDLPNSRF